MTEEQAIDGMLRAKKALQTKQGIDSPMYMSEQMDRLATYTNAVEDFLADHEYDLEIAERNAYGQAVNLGNSPSAAEKMARHDVGEMKASIKKLSRLVGSAWRLVDEKKSRFNHLEKEAKGQV